MTDPDDPGRPMTRLELAQLWELLGRWDDSHPLQGASARFVRVLADAELAERFGA